jgi:hypothetical protein
MIDGGDFFNTLLKDFEEHGASVIERLRDENPLEYLKLIASLVPDDLRINFDAGDAAGEVCH